MQGEKPGSESGACGLAWLSPRQGGQTSPSLGLSFLICENGSHSCTCGCRVTVN